MGARAAGRPRQPGRQRATQGVRSRGGAGERAHRVGSTDERRLAPSASQKPSQNYPFFPPKTTTNRPSRHAKTSLPVPTPTRVSINSAMLGPRAGPHGQRVRERSERVQWHLDQARPSLGRAKGAGGERCDVGYHGCRCPPVSKPDRRPHHAIDCAASVVIARLPAFEPRELARLLPVVTAGGLAHQFTASLCPASSRHVTAAHVEGATPDVDAGACRTGPHARRRGGHTAHAGLGGRVLSRKGGGARAAGIGGARQAQELR